MKNRKLFGVLFLFATCGLNVFGQNAFKQGEKANLGRLDAAVVEKWREDLRLMALEMPKRHKNLYHSITKEQFELAVKRLDELMPTLSRHQAIVELMRIVAMVGDGHTSLNPQFNPKVEFRYYPLRLYQYSDGLFIQAADKKYENVVGARVLKIGKATAEEAFKAATEVVPYDNAMTSRHRVPLFLTIPEVIHALGFIDDMEKAQFLVEKNGKQIWVELSPAGRLPQRTHGPHQDKDPAENWVRMNRDNRSPVPLWLKAPDDKYWFEYLESSRTVYLQYNSVFDKHDETIAHFARRVFEFINSHPVDRLILDVRLNEGGDSFLNMPLLLGIIKAEKINRRGHFFAIIGRGTFSAAQNLVNELERYTNVVFVGEPTGARVNFYGDHDLITLPNSGIRVAVSTLWWQTLNPRDARPWITPAVAAELSSEDYRTNNDPAFTAILNYKSIAEVLEAALSANNMELAMRNYRDFKSDPKTRVINTERDMNSLGYRLLSADKVASAVEIFKLNVEAYPHSANVYDSLADAYVKLGNRELAIKNYQRSLELNPRGDFTRQKLQEVLGKQKPD